MCGMVLCLLLSNTISKAQEVGQQAPPLILPDINGQESNLADLRGNYVYLHFWASWCQNSILQLPNVTEIHKHYKDKNFKIYSVSLDASRDAWLNAIDVYQLTWPQHQCDFRGPFSHNLDNYHFIGTPFGYLISPNGVILEVDPDVHDYTSWFEEGVKQGDYYTVHLGTFSNLTHVDFDYIEEMGVVESGYENGNYYVHLGKYANPQAGEKVLIEALKRGYSEARLITDTYAGEPSLSYVNPLQRKADAIQQYYTQPPVAPTQSNPAPSDQFYPNPFNPTYDSEMSTRPPSTNFNKPVDRPSMNSNYEDFPSSVVETNTFEKKEKKESNSNQFYPSTTPVKPKMNDFQNDDIAIELPEKQPYPNKKEDAWKETQEAKDLFNKPNPFFDPAGVIKDNDNDQPLRLELPQEIQSDENIDEPINSDSYSYGMDDYSNNHPMDNLFLEENNLELDRKETKYERKLRIKKQKAKRKQEKLKREIEATKKEIQELDESLEFSRLYPNE